MSRWRPRQTIRTLGNDAESFAASALWLACLGRLADRVAHEIRNPLNGLALNLEVVRSRSVRPGAEGSALSPYATAATSELERTLPLIDALLSLARPSAFPVDLRSALQPLATLYDAIASAAGGSLRMTYDSEQMFVATDGVTTRTILAEFLDASVGEKTMVTGTVAREGEHVALTLAAPLSRPISGDVQRLSDACGMQLRHAHEVTLLMFPALAHSGVDSKT